MPTGNKDTILDRAVKLLAVHPKSQLCLRNRDRFAASTPTGSQLSEKVIRAAVCTVDQYYGGIPLLGPKISADRIQRLVFGIAELIQAEFVIDQKYESDQIDQELLIALRCLRAGFRSGIGDDVPDEADE